MTLRVLTLLALLGMICLHPARSQTVDAAFAPTTLYRPGPTTSVAQQADGKYLVTGTFYRNATGVIGRVMRYNADFTPDAAFNTALTGLVGGTLFSVRVLPNAQLLLVGDGTLTLNGVSRQDLMRLNDNGTPDPSFNAGTASTVGTASVVELLPTGQLLVGGTFTTYNGLAYSRLVRLTATGSVDASFVPAAFSRTVVRVAAQPDGKVLVMSQNGLTRLNANGSTDASFATVSSTTGLFGGLALQADGKILVGGNGLPYGTGIITLVRLLADGTRDNSFFLASNVFFDFSSSIDNRLIVVQPDGRILIRCLNGSLTRLQANGNQDVSFQSPLSSRSIVSWVALTTTGQVLVAGARFETPGQRSEVALLGPTGTREPAFAPVLLTDGYVDAVAVQPNGMVLAAGLFDEANGTLVNNLARFRADGTVDPGFVPPPFLYVRKLVLQPDGNLLVGQLGTSSQPAIIRLLPTGAPDGSFGFRSRVLSLNQLLLQPDGRLIALIDTFNSNNTLPVRLLANGRRDHSFNSVFSSLVDYARDADLQSDGKVILTGSFAPGGSSSARNSLVRLLPTGLADPAFTPLPEANAPSATSIRLQPDGKILFTDNYYSRLRRLLPGGALDATFTAALPPNAPYILKLQVQPNGYSLISGGLPAYFTRLLPDGSVDASFTSPVFDNVVNDISIATNGQLVLGGTFLTVGGQRRVGLVRLNAANVLTVQAQQKNLSAVAYPNPAHAQLHLALEASARPQRVSLLDEVGRTVLSKTVIQPNVELNTAGLAPGCYVLRVEYATGPVTHRIVIE